MGSNGNVAENGIPAEQNCAAVPEISLATDTTRIFASGLRNADGLAWQPDSGEPWVAVIERDEIGNGLVNEQVTSLRGGGFYSWPYGYFSQTVDERGHPPPPGLPATATAPDHALGATPVRWVWHSTLAPCFRHSIPVERLWAKWAVEPGTAVCIRGHLRPIFGLHTKWNATGHPDRIPDCRR